MVECEKNLRYRALRWLSGSRTALNNPPSWRCGPLSLTRQAIPENPSKIPKIREGLMGATRVAEKGVVGCSAGPGRKRMLGQGEGGGNCQTGIWWLAIRPGVYPPALLNASSYSPSHSWLFQRTASGCQFRTAARPIPMARNRSRLARQGVSPGGSKPRSLANGFPMRLSAFLVSFWYTFAHRLGRDGKRQQAPLVTTAPKADLGSDTV